MNTRRHISVFLLTILSSVTARAALPIDLEIATEPGVPLIAPQEWARMLGRMDLGTVRIRGAMPGDQPTVESQKVGSQARFRVLAILNARNELVLPKRSFRVTERTAMQKYFERLPVEATYHAEERGRFGLTEKQFRQVHSELSQPVGFSTMELTPAEVLRQIERMLASPIQQVGKLRAREPLGVELQQFSMGTALAVVLRTQGLALRPEQLPGEPLRLAVVSLDTPGETWPVGWKPSVTARHSAPHLFESRIIEISGFTLTQAITALQPALQLPVLWDTWILEQRKIDPSEIDVKLAPQRTFLKSALSKLLSQARLTLEVRVDEQEQPFVWVTRFGKQSAPATK